MNSVSQRKTDTKYHTVAFTCEFFESSKPRYTLLTTENKLINTRGRWGGMVSQGIGTVAGTCDKYQMLYPRV